jgi:hypothetical protein
MTRDEYLARVLPKCKAVPHLADDLPCLVWQGATINKGRDPRAVMWKGGPPVQVRRVAWDVANPDKPLGKDTARPACECQHCVEPTHMERMTPSQFRSVPKSLAGRLNMQAAARASRSFVKNPEVIVPMVLEDPRPAYKVAADLGLSEDVVLDMRRGKWNNAAFGRNPFTGLGAR